MSTQKAAALYECVTDWQILDWAALDEVPVKGLRSWGLDTVFLALEKCADGYWRPARRELPAWLPASQVPGGRLACVPDRTANA